MKKYFKSLDNKIYLDVTDQAKKLFGALDLFIVWTKENKTHNLPIVSLRDLAYGLKNNNMHVCIEVGTEDALLCIIQRHLPNLDKMNTITHEGFVYVKYNDILNCE